MSEEIKVHWADEAQLLGYGESDSTGAWLKFRVQPEDLEAFRGLKGEVFAMSLVKLDEMTGELEKPNPVTTEKKDPPPKKTKGEYGKYIAKLHTSGFFMAPKVHSALGGDASYQAWCRLQPCVVCGDYDYVEMGEGRGLEPRCEYAHVNRADNSGKGMKAPMSGLPNCHKHHQAQHNSGYSVIFLEHLDRKGEEFKGENVEEAAKAWAESEVTEHLVKWAHAKLGVIFKTDSLTKVPPEEIYRWAHQKSLIGLLPAMFKKADIVAKAGV